MLSDISTHTCTMMRPCHLCVSNIVLSVYMHDFIHTHTHPTPLAHCCHFALFCLCFFRYTEQNPFHYFHLSPETWFLSTACTLFVFNYLRRPIFHPPLPDTLFLPVLLVPQAAITVSALSSCPHSLEQLKISKQTFPFQEPYHLR